MQCTNLLKDLDAMIINELMSPVNCTRFYHDALLVSNLSHLNLSFTILLIAPFIV